MDESVLKTLLACLDSSRASLDSQLWWATFLVVVGVGLEWIFVIWEYREELHDFRRGIVHAPEKPNVWLFVLGLVATSLVTIGVAGEMYVGAKIGDVETRIRKANDERAALLSKLAGNAAVSARNAEESSEESKRKLGVVREEANALSDRLKAASKKLAGMEQQVRIQGPRWKLLEDNKSEFIDALTPFARQRVTVIKCGDAIQAEPERLEQDLLNFLGVSSTSKPNAEWAVNSPGYSVWRSCNTGATSVGGNLVITSATASEPVKTAAKALFDVLNKLDISTIETQAQDDLKARNFFDAEIGADSPWSLATKDPTQVFILVGTNPMFDLSGWHKRRKQSAKP